MRGQIVKILKGHTESLSGEELSRELRVSRAAVWKNIQELRRLGYKIEAATNSGYRLLNSPDKLFPWEIQAGLATVFFGKTVFYQDEVHSTMDEAFRLAREGAAEGTVVCAETQIKGRGRMGRGWVSPKGKGIYLSLIVRPMLPLSEVAKLTLLTSVAVCESLCHISGLDIKIKWPNDLFLKEKKIAGILTELNAEVDRVNFVIIGIGINVNTSVRQIPDIATSLKIGAGRDFSRVQVIQKILENFERHYKVSQREGFASALMRWRERSCTLGRRVVLHDSGKAWEGTAVDLADDGGLLIRNSQGKIFKRMTGDVEIKG